MLHFPEWADGDSRDVPESQCRCYTVPTHFYDDHVARDLTAGVEVKRTKARVTVWLDKVAYDDLYGDADYYATLAGTDFADNRGLCLSARATLRSLEG